jgi:hypothetical protein
MAGRGVGKPSATFGNAQQPVEHRRTYAVGRAVSRQYGNSAIRQYGYNSSTWFHEWLGADSVQLRNSYTVQQLIEQRNPSVVDDVGFNGADNVEENPLSGRIGNKDRFL